MRLVSFVQTNDWTIAVLSNSAKINVNSTNNAIYGDTKKFESDYSYDDTKKKIRRYQKLFTTIPKHFYDDTKKFL